MCVTESASGNSVVNGSDYRLLQKQSKHSASNFQVSAVTMQSINCACHSEIDLSIFLVHGIQIGEKYI